VGEEQQSVKAIVTGMNGTVAPALARRLREQGLEAVPWDRAKSPTDSERAVRAFIERERPMWVCHIATGALEWAEWISRACAELGPRLLWTGSVSVFSDRHTPPIPPEAEPDASDDYGRYKADCERRVLAANPGVIVARLGWQIGAAPGSNNMVDYLSREAEKGAIRASHRWVPSCAMLDDTASALVNLMARAEPGVFHLEGNTAGLSMFDLATRLNHAQRRGWTIEPTDEPNRDNRMHDHRVRMAQVKDRLPAP